MEVDPEEYTLCSGPVSDIVQNFTPIGAEQKANLVSIVIIQTDTGNNRCWCIMVYEGRDLLHFSLSVDDA